MTKVASYLSRKVGRRTFLKDQRSEPPQWNGDGSEPFAGGDKPTFRNSKLEHPTPVWPDPAVKR